MVVILIRHRAADPDLEAVDIPIHQVEEAAEELVRHRQLSQWLLRAVDLVVVESEYLTRKRVARCQPRTLSLRDQISKEPQKGTKAQSLAQATLCFFVFVDC